MAAIVIADAGPLIALAKLDRLTLLQQLFGSVVLPRAVQRECLAKDSEDSRRIVQAIDAGILCARAPEGDEPALARSLGDGEKEAIRLALRNGSALLLLDDRIARRAAARLGLHFIGTVRLLDVAERTGLIGDAGEAVARVREIGYRISDGVLKQLRSRRARVDERDTEPGRGGRRP